MASKISPSDILFIREAFGWNQADLAQEVGVQHSAVSHWELGIRSPSGPASILLEKLLERANKRADKKSSVRS